MKAAVWSVYLIRTKHNTLYCGISNDVTRRFERHVAGKGAKALRGKGPLILAWQQRVGDKSAAAKVEYAIKQLRKEQKEALILQQLQLNQDQHGATVFSRVNAG